MLDLIVKMLSGSRVKILTMFLDRTYVLFGTEIWLDFYAFKCGYLMCVYLYAIYLMYIY
nr:MAG TPA: hypothetical protein [Caudoviricetes sp.]